jgi:FtsP/CotA-like multicopper oxidase with cupredoxin domain
MDISDVGYDLFLINGQKELSVPAKPGETILFRIINASAGTYFYLQFAGDYMKVLSVDGQDVGPFDIDRILIAIAETYDVTVVVSDKGSFEFRATAQDGSGSVSAFVGEGEKVFTPDIPKPDLYRMHTAGHESMDMSMDMQKHDMHKMDDMGMTADKRPLPPYEHLRSVRRTALRESNPVRTITLTLDGDMERFVWTINGKILSEAEPIIIRKGENVRIDFENKSMMHHPMHLALHYSCIKNRPGEAEEMKKALLCSPRRIRPSADDTSSTFTMVHQRKKGLH